MLTELIRECRTDNVLKLGRRLNLRWMIFMMRIMGRSNPIGKVVCLALELWGSLDLVLMVGLIGG